MKKCIIIFCLILSGGLYGTMSAQNVNVTVNISQQPAWGPTGYDYAGYYYFPDLNIYFDVNNALFYYLSGSNWISNKYLPDKYRKYDLYSLYKVVVNDSQPWNQNKNHKKSYSSYKGDKTQTTIRNSNDSKYSTSKGNTNVWVNTDESNKNNKNNTSAKQGESKGQSSQNNAGNRGNNGSSQSGKQSSQSGNGGNSGRR